MKLVIDMNLTPRWAGVFMEAGFDAVHWSKVGAAYDSDREIMAFAKLNDHVIFTNDLDFGLMLAATNADGPSVIQVRKGVLRPERIGLQVLEALRELSVELEQGALVTIDPKKTRVRVLPLR